jgi:hypothetical protein
MRRLIPTPLIALISDVVSNWETHATLDSLFLYAGAPGEPPAGSKQVKALDWLRQVNTDVSIVDPLAVIGKIIEGYIEQILDPKDLSYDLAIKRNTRIQDALERFNLQYASGGKIISALAAPSRTLAEMIRGRDLASINLEFERAYDNIEHNPREAVSAACNILESICKIYIGDESLEMPSKQDLQPVWSVVRKDLGFDPSEVADRDLQEILSGLLAVVSGVGALRTHASSAHGSGRKAYKIEPRHARLAAHAAHTIALFILESWDKKRKVPNTGSS